MVVALLACVVSGCNSDVKTAREYLNSAYGKSKSVVENQVKFEEKGQEFFDYYEGLSVVTPEDIQRMDQYFNELTAITEAINTAADETRAEYEKVLGLDDVDKYKKYAENRIEAIGLTREWVEQFNKFSDVLRRSFNESLAGGVPDEGAIMSETTPITDERERIEAEIERLNDEAAALREELDVD